jgi:uncharacterized membrane protein YhaH (DUF805 family)
MTEQKSTRTRNHWSFNPFSYKGRIGRLNYLVGAVLATVISWAYETAVIVYGFAFFLVFSQSSFAGTVPPLVSMLLLPAIWGVAIASVPAWLYSSLHVKRLHDLDFPGRFIFPWLFFEYGREARPKFGYGWRLAPIFARGTVGPNRYGEDPVPDSGSRESARRPSRRKTFIVVAVIIAVILLLSGAGIILMRVYQGIGTDQLDRNSYRIITTDSFGRKRMEVAIGTTLGCYSVTYDPKLLFPDYQETAGTVVLNPVNGFFSISINPGYIGNVNALASQIASQLNPKATTQNFATASGLKGEEITWSNGWQILIPAAVDKNENTVVLSVDAGASSDEAQSLQMGQTIAQSVTASSICLQNLWERIKLDK